MTRRTGIDRKDNSKISFNSARWVRISGNGRDGRAKVAFNHGTRLRMLQFYKGWNEHEWCKLGHIGYMVSGEITLEFKSGKPRSMLVRKGEAFFIHEGQLHRALAKRSALTFIVDKQ